MLLFQSTVCFTSFPALGSAPAASNEDTISSLPLSHAENRSGGWTGITTHSVRNLYASNGNTQYEILHIFVIHSLFHSSLATFTWIGGQWEVLQSNGELGYLLSSVWRSIVYTLYLNLRAVTHVTCSNQQCATMTTPTQRAQTIPTPILLCAQSSHMTTARLCPVPRPTTRQWRHTRFLFRIPELLSDWQLSCIPSEPLPVSYCLWLSYLPWWRSY